LTARDASLSKLHHEHCITKQGLTAQVHQMKQREARLKATLLDLQSSLKQKQQDLMSLELKAATIEDLAAQLQLVLQNKEDEVQGEKV
jgi:hypothetical protein